VKAVGIAALEISSLLERTNPLLKQARVVDEACELRRLHDERRSVR
jgi:hypothetical protein